MNHYGLDPAWYFSAPGLAQDAALKITKVHLDLLSDSDMLLMIDSGIRGGIVTISHCHAKANNKYMELSSILLSNLNSSHIQMQLTYMDGQCRNNFQRPDLNG